jgi:hypothetical protein
MATVDSQLTLAQVPLALMIEPQVGTNIKQNFQIYLPLVHHVDHAENTPSHVVHLAGA